MQDLRQVVHRRPRFMILFAFAASEPRASLTNCRNAAAFCACPLSVDGLA